MTKGGKRVGAGRPQIDPQKKKIPVGYKLPRWVVAWLRKEPRPASQLIEEALTSHFQIGIKQQALKETVETSNQDQ